MGKKNKLARFAECKTFTNLFEYSFERIKEEGFPLKGKWHDFFGNDNPIVLELGCGKGEYTIGLAKQHPDINYIGIDIKGARMWVGLKQGISEGLKNVAFVRTRIELIENFFDKDEVDEIWITFPDPQILKARKRLTAPIYLDRYRTFLKKEGFINLKTDSDILYEFTCDVIEESNFPVVYNYDDLYANDDELEVKSIRTYYEEMWLKQGLTIKYLKFQI
ncbi:MAG: tRNA (guanosine(46)-N7)-methyltransferase TrmB [Candidatus Limimorpha sp.]